MADDGQIRGIDWRQTFPFTRLFGSFMTAIHPTKLGLALALLFTIYFGGCILDLFWPPRSSAVPGEIVQYQRIVTGKDSTTLSVWREQTQRSMEENYAQLLITYNVIKPTSSAALDEGLQQRALEAARDRSYLSQTKDAIIRQRDDETVKRIDDQYNLEVKAADDAFAERPTAPGAVQARDDTKAKASAERDAAVAAAFDQASQEIQQVKNLKGQGLFDAFFQYQIRQISGVVDGVLRNNWLGPDGVVEHVSNFFTVGPVWLVWHHVVFFILFSIVFLFAWSLFGGAICRLIVVEMARDVKLPVRQAMNFAMGKVLSFACAPVLPILVVLLIGLVVGAGSLLLGNWMFVGPIILGVGFVLALMAGAVATLLLIGTGAGFGLMYPSIAAEGTDGFDAISQSFSYVYTEPWRLLFYTIVGVIYGAITYMFVHVFIWLTLSLTHHFVGMGMISTAANNRNLFDMMWPGPSATGRLSYRVDGSYLSWGQGLGAFFIRCWVLFIVSFLGAFAISMYFTLNSAIYFLMRNAADGTEMDDVYMEESQDELEPLPPWASESSSAQPTDAKPGDSSPTSPPADVPPA